MKKILLIALVALAFTGCQDIRQEFSHFNSSIRGINRTITLYGNDGKELRKWDFKGKVEDAGGTCRFLTNDGKAVTIAGTFVIEEK